MLQGAQVARLHQAPYKTADVLIAHGALEFSRTHGRIAEPSGGSHRPLRRGSRLKKGYLEIFVASSNLASLTGLLSELGNKLGESVTSHGLTEDDIKPETDDRLKEALEQTMSLLERFSLDDE